jgi:hypothetical protein
MYAELSEALSGTGYWVEEEEDNETGPRLDIMVYPGGIGDAVGQVVGTTLIP